MKNTLLTLALIIAGIFCCNAQRIESKKVFGGYQYTQNGENLDLNELTAAIQANAEANGHLKKARSKSTIASILGGVGGAFVGYPLGQAIAGGEANWAMAGVGAGVVAIGIPISFSANRSARRAVDIYNSTQPQVVSSGFMPQYKLVGNSQGIGFALNF